MAGDPFAIDLVRVVAIALPAVATGLVLRRRRLSHWPGPEGTLAACTLTVSSLMFGAQLLGGIGHLRFGPLVVVNVMLLALALLVRPRSPSPGASGEDDWPSVEESRRWHRICMVGGVVVVAGQWATRVAEAYSRGTTDYDSLHYHLPRAARFVQLERVTELHFFSADGVPNMFHPSNADLLHALGMIAFENDLASPALNSLWAAFGLLAAWCIGRSRGEPHLSALGFLVVLGLPFTALSAGSALDDVPSYACLLTAVAFLVQTAGNPIDRSAMAGLAAGLALSSKLTMLAPVAGLTLGVLWLARRRPQRTALWMAWLGPLILTGSFWYLRNLAVAGSPLPSVAIPGFPRARFDSVERYGFSVAHYLNEPVVVREWLVPGLHAGVGAAWPLLVAACALATFAGLRRRSPGVVRILSAITLVIVLAYAVTPTTAMGLPGQPTFFALNLRYVFPAIVLALALAPASLDLRARFVAIGLGIVPICLILASAFIPAGALPGFGNRIPAWSSDFRAVGLLCMASVAAIGWFRLLRPREARAPSGGGVSRWLALGLLPAAIVAAHLLDRHYRDGRFSDDRIAVALGDSEPTAVAVVGIDRQLAFYGATLGNRVQFIGLETPHGGFDVIPTCEDLRGQIVADDYEYVVLAELPPPVGPPIEWTSEWAALTERARDEGRVLYAIDPGVSDGSCD